MVRDHLFVLVDVIQVLTVQAAQVQEPCDTTRLDLTKNIFGLSQIVHHILGDLAEVRAAMVWSAAKELRLVAYPVG